MNTSLIVKPVNTKQQRDDFLMVPHLVFAGDRNWVAPLFLERQEHIDPRKNPYFQHAEVQLFVAYRDGNPVGRISAQDDQLRLKTYNDNKGMFGFLDALDDSEIFDALLKASADWLRSRGRTSMIGPFSFSINDEAGTLIDGFDSIPNMMMPHSRPWYQKHIEKLGCKKAKDVIAYRYDFTTPPRVLEKVRDRALASGDFVVRPLKLSDMKSEVKVLIDIFNDAWSKNWGFVPWTQAELDKLGKDMKLLINANYGYVASYKGEEAAFAVTLPNLNTWIKGMNGRVLPFNWAKLIGKIVSKKPTSVRMPLMGVRKKFHDSPVGSALSTLVIDAARQYHVARGVKEMELSWILEDNLPVRRIIELCGAVPHKTYRIYEKPL
jgi:hypothetical protein